MIADSGPIYTETDTSQFPVEPWNTYSEAAVLIVSVYWMWKVRSQIGDFKLTFISALILLPQWLGATLYHATRASNFYLLLDVVPILLFALVVWGSLFASAIEHYTRGLIYYFVTIVVGYFLYQASSLSSFFSNSSGYLALVFLVVSMMLFHAPFSKRAGVHAALVFGLFIVALIFRQLDFLLGASFVPMGSHFLWHLCAALGAHYVIRYCHLWEASYPNVSGALTALYRYLPKCVFQSLGVRR